jgi:hypothetical protein
MYFELSPAYGRDFKNAKEVKTAFEDGIDFAGDYQLGFKLVNRAQLPKGATVNLRYDKMRKVAVTKA